MPRCVPSQRVRYITYRVSRAERLTAIAARYHLPVADVRAANPRVKRSRPRQGHRLVIPAVAAPSALAMRATGAVGSSDAHRSGRGKIHRVRRGETLTAIARRYRVSVRALSRGQRHLAAGTTFAPGCGFASPAELSTSHTEPGDRHVSADIRQRRDRHHRLIRLAVRARRDGRPGLDGLPDRRPHGTPGADHLGASGQRRGDAARARSGRAGEPLRLVRTAPPPPASRSPPGAVPAAWALAAVQATSPRLRESTAVARTRCGPAPSRRCRGRGGRRCWPGRWCRDTCPQRGLPPVAGALAVTDTGAGLPRRQRRLHHDVPAGRTGARDRRKEVAGLGGLARVHPQDSRDGRPT